jgi:hypothetical protein
MALTRAGEAVFSHCFRDLASLMKSTTHSTGAAIARETETWNVPVQL